MIALLCFFLTVFGSPFKSKSRLEAENAALRHQLIGVSVEVHASLPSRRRWTSERFAKTVKNQMLNLARDQRVPARLPPPIAEGLRPWSGAAPRPGQPLLLVWHRRNQRWRRGKHACRGGHRVMRRRLGILGQI